jgi:hypothetical protein
MEGVAKATMETNRQPTPADEFCQQHNTAQHVPVYLRLYAATVVRETFVPASASAALRVTSTTISTRQFELIAATFR